MPEVYTLNSTVMIRIHLIVRIQKLEDQTLKTGHTTCIFSCILCDLVRFCGCNNLANFTHCGNARGRDNRSGSDGDGVTDEIVTSEVLIDRDDNIFIAIYRSGDLIGVHIGSGKIGTVTIPIPFPGLFVTRGVGVGGQHNRVAGANLRCRELRDRSRGDGEVVNRGKRAFATATGYLY